jgi:hypothetical protein
LLLAFFFPLLVFGDGEVDKGRERGGVDYGIAYLDG